MNRFPSLIVRAVAPRVAVLACALLLAAPPSPAQSTWALVDVQSVGADNSSESPTNFTTVTASDGSITIHRFQQFGAATTDWNVAFSFGGPPSALALSDSINLSYSGSGSGTGTFSASLSVRTDTASSDGAFLPGSTLVDSIDVGPENASASGSATVPLPQSSFASFFRVEFRAAGGAVFYVYQRRGSPPAVGIPRISSISPDTVAAGSSSFSLLVSGSGFAPDAVVLWDEQPLDTDVLNSEQVEAFVPEGLIGPPVVAAVSLERPRPANGGRQVPIRVQNPTHPNPSLGVSNPATLTISPSTATPNDRSILPPGLSPPPLPKPTPTTEIFQRSRWVRASELAASCAFQADGPLSFDIRLDRFFGAVDAQGKLRDPTMLVQNGVIAPFARLRIAAWDVDSSSPAGLQPERDRVRLNGRDLAGGAFLQGGDEQWRINEFRVPVSDLFFPELPAADSDLTPLSNPNRIEIDIDVADPNAPVGWCVAVPWVSLEISAMAPWMLVHGTAAQDETWTEYPVQGRTAPQHLQGLGIPFEHRIVLEANGSADRNALLLYSQLQLQARRFGSKRLHLIAHSKGATDAREMFSEWYDPDEFEVLSLFSLGTPSQGTVLSDLSVAADSVDTDIALAGSGSNDPEIADQIRRAKGGAGLSIFESVPSDPARTLQTIAGMAEFNRNRPKHKLVPYYSLAGHADVNRNDELEDNEVEAFRLIDPNGMFAMLSDLDLWLANGFHRALSRVRGARLATRTEQSVGGGGFLPGGLTTTWTIVEADTSGTPRLNDLTSTVDSVHCTHCGFTPLGSNICAGCPQAVYEENHSSLKRPRIMDVIREEIGARYPLVNFGGTSP